MVVPNQPKRGMMFNVIKPIIESGVHPETLAELIHWRKNALFYKFDEILDEEAVIERLAEEDVGGKVRKHRSILVKMTSYFTLMEIRTYLLTSGEREH